MFNIVLILHLLSAGLTGGESGDSHFVKVDVSLADSVLRPGDRGRVLVSFTPVDGIHINVDPPVTLTIRKNSLLSLQGNPDMTTDKVTGFLSTETPVGQLFSISHKATPGPHTITGTITYYFCSDTEGWCRKQSQAVTLTLNIKGH